MQTEERVVSVYPLGAVGRMLAYRLPPGLEGVGVGSLVRIPVGPRTVPGIVRALGHDGAFPVGKLRFVLDCMQPFPVLDAPLLELAEWMAGYYGAPLDSVLEVMLPAPVRAGGREKRLRLLRVARMPEAAELERLRRQAPTQAALIEFLSRQVRPVPRAQTLQRAGAGAPALAALIKRGLVEEVGERQEREAYADELAGAEIVASAPPALNEEQATAAASVARSLEAGKFAVHLLQGVTGSGKTEVYLDAIGRVADAGGGVVFLVPEVSLAPQTVGRLRSRLEARGVRTVVWHSSLSGGERVDSWLALARGEARVVVGARSAVFAPVKNLRLLIVDEEHEPAYKQDETPRYNGRDVAVMRASRCGAVALLGSATPSLESVENVRAGKYRSERLTRRVDDRRLPRIHVVDMRRERGSRGEHPVLSTFLVEKIRSRLDLKEQVILFINRRGYSSSMPCQECGHVPGCGHCSVTLTFHRFDGTLKCHLCGHVERAPQLCPQCRSPRIRWQGLGTQRVEEMVGRIAPKARIMRVDTDAGDRRDGLRRVLADFRLGRIDVLVGTQMIAKGLDFPNVTLVGLVDADISMHLPDFRSNERTLQLLVQVSGRAGRGDKPGEVVLQTYCPDAPPIQFAKSGQVDDFIGFELEQRRQFDYPPYRHLIRQIISGPYEDKVAFVAETWARQAAPLMPAGVEVRGPAPAPVLKLRDVYRYQIWFFTKSVTRTVAALRAQQDAFVWPSDIRIVTDVDPMGML